MPGSHLDERFAGTFQGLDGLGRLLHLNVASRELLVCQVESLAIFDCFRMFDDKRLGDRDGLVPGRERLVGLLFSSVEPTEMKLDHYRKVADIGRVPSGFYELPAVRRRRQERFDRVAEPAIAEIARADVVMIYRDHS